METKHLPRIILAHAVRLTGVLMMVLALAGFPLEQVRVLAHGYVPNPWFTAFPPGVVEGWDWPLDAVVHLTIDDPNTGASPDFERDGTSVIPPWGGTGNWLWIEFPGEYDMKPGDIVRLTDGVTERTHIVKNLSITSVDMYENTVSGLSDAGEKVILWSWEDPLSKRLEVTADGSGQWMADFDDVGFDLMPEYHVRAEVWDDGNDTAVDWYIPNPPRFSIFPGWEWFDGLDWPDGATVSISVLGKPECSLEKESWGGFFNGNFPQGCDVVAGDTVTFTDGATSRTHTVRNLAITAVDTETDTVGGTADEEAVVNVWPHSTGDLLQATADASGAWQVDFTGIIDLVYGESIRAEIQDEMGNATTEDWTIPNMQFLPLLMRNTP